MACNSGKKTRRKRAMDERLQRDMRRKLLLKEAKKKARDEEELRDMQARREYTTRPMSHTMSEAFHSAQLSMTSPFKSKKKEECL